MIMRAAPGPLAESAPPDRTADVVRAGLQRAATVLEAQGVPVPELDGKLLRPTLAYALVPPEYRPKLDDRFWLGALAIQMVHEASLLHDDVLDEATERRGSPTVFAAHGVGAALVRGDQFLTASYRAALWTRSATFLERFITSVERTVAGEVLQGRTAGQHVDLDAYFEAILGKSGELLRASATLGACLLELDGVEERGQLGLELGALYQQVDDLLDYCPAAATGKEGLKDYRQRKWTWVLDLADLDTWDATDEEVFMAVFGTRESEPRAADRAVTYLEVRRSALLRKLERLVPGDDLVISIVDEWIGAARSGIERQAAALAGSDSVRQASNPSSEAEVVEAASRLGDPEAWRRYFREHARTFSFASRLFPEGERRRVEALYAYCRFTDDLVDGAERSDNPEKLAGRVRAWRGLSREAFEGQRTGVPLLDVVMGDAASAGVDWLYPEALLDGVEMDLRPRSYRTWSDLGRYCFCVAGSVGGWMTHLFGIRDPDTLGRAHALGHAMQLTNIVRDVGEDLCMGRIYLPLTLLDAHDVSVADMTAWARSSDPLPERWLAAMEEVIAVADERYEWAQPGIAVLPSFFRRPVAVAAAAYRGIHDSVRRNGYDNLRLRASTSTARKAGLGALGLMRSRKAHAEYGVAKEGLAT